MRPPARCRQWRLLWRLRETRCETSLWPKKTAKKMKGKDDVGCGDAPPAGLRSPVFEVALENASDEMEKYEVLGMKLRVARWGVDALH